MNATETIFALALASNFEQQSHFDSAYRQIQSLGLARFSNIYLIPCRDGVGADYWNSACLIKCSLSAEEMLILLKEIEKKSGRVRPSHKIALDIDLIAWGEDLTQMQFNPKKLPLALDVKIPLGEIWNNPLLYHTSPYQYPVI